MALGCSSGATLAAAVLALLRAMAPLADLPSPETPPALQLPGDEGDNVGHHGRRRLIHRRRHMSGVG